MCIEIDIWPGVDIRSCFRTPDLPYEVVTPGETDDMHSAPSMERQGAIEVAKMATEATDLANDALWNAKDLRNKLRNALHDSQRVVDRCLRTYHSSQEVLVAAEVWWRGCDFEPAPPQSTDLWSIDCDEKENARTSTARRRGRGSTRRDSMKKGMQGHR